MEAHSGSHIHGTDQQPKVNPQLLILELERDFITHVAQIVLVEEKKSDQPTPKSFLLKGIQEALTKHILSLGPSASSLPEEQKAIHDATSEIIGLLFDDILSYELISNPMLLTSGHTLDRRTFKTLQTAGMKNPMTWRQLEAVAEDADSNQRVIAVIACFKSLLRHINEAVDPLLPAKPSLQHQDLPGYLQEIIPAPEGDPNGLQAQNFLKYLGFMLLPALFLEQEVAVDVARVLQKDLGRDLPLANKRGIRPFALLIVFLSGAVLTTVGLSAFVDGLFIYKAFMLFVAANGVGGIALAGIVLGVGILMMVGVLAYLLWPSQKPPVPAPMPAAAAAIAELVHHRQENIITYPRLAIVAEVVQAPGRAQRSENVRVLRKGFLEVITDWLYKALWAFGLYQQGTEYAIESRSKAFAFNLHDWRRQLSENLDGELEDGQRNDRQQEDRLHVFSSPLSSSYGHDSPLDGFELENRSEGGRLLRQEVVY